MSEPGREWRRGGRTLRWRAGMVCAGLLLAAYAAALVAWPQLVAWTIAAVVGGLGGLCIVSALFARSRGD